MVAGTKEDHGWLHRVRQREKRAEVGVTGHHNAMLLSGENEEFVVLGAFQPEFERVHSVVASVTKKLGQARRPVLVDEEPHAMCLSRISRSATASAA